MHIYRLEFQFKLSNSNYLCFLDDDNYFISDNSIENIINLFKNYSLIIGLIKDNNGNVFKKDVDRVKYNVRVFSITAQ